MDLSTEEDEQLDRPATGTPVEDDRPATGTPVEDELFQSDDEEEGFVSDGEEFHDPGERNAQRIEPKKSI